MTHKNYVQNLAATHLSFEHFMHFMVYKSIDHRKLQSICLINDWFTGSGSLFFCQQDLKKSVQTAVT